MTRNEFVPKLQSALLQFRPSRATGWSLCLLLLACGPEAPGPGRPAVPVAATVGAAPSLPADAEVAPWRVELLQLAFDAASALPLDPHVKNRARAQAAVVAACLQLDLPGRAARWAQAIPNWQRGVCFADLALWCAGHGAQAAVGGLLEQAEAVAREVLADPREQGWRAERIRTRIGAAILMLDDAARAALASPGAGYDEVLAGIDRVLVAGDLEQVTAALQQCADLHAQQFAVPARQAALAQRIRDARVPANVRLDVTLRLVATALDHGDRDRAAAWLDELQPIVEGGTWLPEDQAALRARLCVARHRAGADERARRDLDDATSAFEAVRSQIHSVFRGQASRPLAEAWRQCGDPARALAIYRQAIADALLNPNSRPRAEDLVATCISMAVAEVAPDDGLRTTLRTIAAGLGDPW